jgi:hypothetical protein
MMAKIFSLILLLIPLASCFEDLIISPRKIDDSLPSKVRGRLIHCRLNSINGRQILTLFLSPAQLLLYIPGANVPPSNYTLPLAELQDKVSSSVNLFVALPGFSAGKCIISCPNPSLCSALNKHVQSLITSAGSFDPSDIILGAHSLGGTCANYLIQAYPDTPEYHNALILSGGYVDEIGDYSLENYPSKTLTIGAELDGGAARPGKLASWVYQSERINNFQQSAVIIIPGIDHSDFCPGFQVPGDIYPSDVSQDSAVAVVSSVTAAWLKLSIFDTATPLDKAFLKHSRDYTTSLLEPYFAALDYEIATLTEPDNLHFLGEGGMYSPICEKAQEILGGFTEEEWEKVSIVRTCDEGDDFEATRGCAYLNVTDDLEHSRSSFEVVEPADGSGEKSLLVNISAHADFYGDFLNTGSFTAAKQIACKMITGARIAEQMGYEYDAPTSRNTCKEANQWAVDTAMELLKGTRSLERFEERGKKICLKDDFDAFFSAGPAWIKEELQYKETDACMEISSVKIDTELDSKLFPGVHYCKLLSPARVIDWVFTDSLK